MSKKNSIKKAAALMLGLALTVGATGCDFISTDSVKDLQQTVATVNISSLIAEKSDIAEFADDLNAVIDFGGVSKDIPKRDLVSYFMSVGYTYVQSYGYSYTDTFNMLLDMLVSRKIVTQYAVVYYLKKGLTANGCQQFIDNDKTAQGLSDKEKALIAEHPEVSAMKYFLTENGAKNDLFEKVLYQMKSSINSSLDSTEQTYITAAEEEHDHGTPRTTPTGVDTEKEDFFIAPKVDDQNEVSRYEVYTGFNQNGIPYGYEALDGSNQYTRRKAYNAFIGNLDDNGLLKKTDNPTVFSEMDYYYVELASRLEQALIEKYTDDLIAEGDTELQAAYMTDRYTQTYNAQKVAYDADTNAFSADLDALSDTKFVTYAPDLGEGFNYGFVYNILLPFSEEQNRLYAAEEARSTDAFELYGYRAKLLEDVKGKDLRDSWFSEHDHANYAFKATDAGVDYYANGGSEYIFFENNLTNNERYEKLNVYLGQYPFNGSVVKDEDDGKFELKATALGIDAFLGEMENYIEYAVGADSITKPFASTDVTVKKATNAEGYWNEYKKNGNYVNVEDDGKTFTDYSEFIYYAGKVNVGNSTPANYFNPETAGYKAAAAFNELMFAYSTDTGCLNTYMGYLVDPFSTNFVPEFEYAAQWAIKQGAGTYVVCPSTYGWHIIYVTCVFGAGDVYGGYVEAEAETEGTFSYMYMEALKAEYSSQYANKEQTRLILEFDNDSCVSRNQKAYQDLLDLDK